MGRIPPLWWLLELAIAGVWTGCATLLGPGVVLVVALLAVWLLVLAVGLRQARPRAARAATAATVRSTLGWKVWAAAALPAAAVAAQVVALGAATDQRWGSFLVLGVLGATGLVAAVLVAPGPRSQPSRPAGRQ